MMSSTVTLATIICLWAALVLVQSFEPTYGDKKSHSKLSLKAFSDQKDLGLAGPMMWQTLGNVHSITIKKLTMCAKAGDQLIMTKPPSISPMTIKPGDTVEIRLLATLRTNVTGGQIKISVLFYQKSVDLCTTLGASGVLKCPVSAGTFNYEQTPLKFQFPPKLPVPITGSFNIKVTVNDNRGQELTCLGLSIAIN